MVDTLFDLETMECGISHLSVYLVNVNIQDFGNKVIIILSKFISCLTIVIVSSVPQYISSEFRQKKH